MKGLAALAILLIITFVVIVAIGGYAWFTFSKYFHGGGTQSYKILAENQTATLSSVLQNMTQGFNTTQFEVSYSGNAMVNLDGIQLVFPLTLGVAKYYNDSMAKVVIDNIPLVGNVSTIQIKNGSSYYTCESGVNSSKRGYQCSSSIESNSVFAISGFAFNGSTPQEVGSATIHFGTPNQSSYNGMPCTNTNGYFSYANATELNSMNITSMIGQRVSSANVLFLSCVSAQYKIPLTMIVQLTAKTGNTNTTASMELYEASYSTSSSAAITALPGPLMDQTR